MSILRIISIEEILDTYDFGHSVKFSVDWFKIEDSELISFKVHLKCDLEADLTIFIKYDNEEVDDCHIN